MTLIFYVSISDLKLNKPPVLSPKPSSEQLVKRFSFNRSKTNDSPASTSSPIAQKLDDDQVNIFFQFNQVFLIFIHQITVIIQIAFIPTVIVLNKFFENFVLKINKGITFRHVISISACIKKLTFAKFYFFLLLEESSILKQKIFCF